MYTDINALLCNFHEIVSMNFHQHCVKTSLKNKSVFTFLFFFSHIFHKPLASVPHFFIIHHNIQTYKLHKLPKIITIKLYAHQKSFTPWKQALFETTYFERYCFSSFLNFMKSIPCCIANLSVKEVPDSKRKVLGGKYSMWYQVMGCSTK